MRGGKVSVGESPSYQTVLVVWAGVDLPSPPGKIPVIDRVSLLMRWTHVLLIHLVAYSNCHVLVPVRVDRHH